MRRLISSVVESYDQVEALDMSHHNNYYQINYLCGWQYMFSPKFRSQVHQKWFGNTWLRVTCVLGGLIGMVLSLIFFVFLIAAFWELLNRL